MIQCIFFQRIKTRFLIFYNSATQVKKKKIIAFFLLLVHPTIQSLKIHTHQILSSSTNYYYKIKKFREVILYVHLQRIDPWSKIQDPLPPQGDLLQ